MKNLVFAALLIIFSLPAFSQDYQIFPQYLEKGTNVIIGEMSGPADSVLIAIGRKLQSLGYGIAMMDKDLLAIASQPKAPGRNSFVAYVLNVSVVPNGGTNKVYLRGQLSGEALGTSMNNGVQWKGLSSGGYKQSFSDMVVTANQLGFKKLEAKKE